MNTEQLIRKSEDLILWFDKNIDGVEIQPEERFRLAAGCLDVALEHHKAVILLIKNHLYGSAFAIVRSLFETYVRGIWLHRCASDLEIELFKGDKLKHKFDKLCADVEKAPYFNCGTLSSIKNRAWKAMNSYTHGGFLQIVRRNTESSIQPNYTEGEIIEVINNSNAFALFSVMAIASLSGNENLANAVLEKHMFLIRQDSNQGAQPDEPSARR